MEQIIKALEISGVSSDICEAIRNNPDNKESQEYALLCAALFDDRHEYVD